MNAEIQGFREEIKTAMDPALMGLVIGALGGHIAAKRSGAAVEKALKSLAKASKTVTKAGGPLTGAALGTLFGMAFRKPKDPKLSNNAKKAVKEMTLSSGNIYGQKNVHTRF